MPKLVLCIGISGCGKSTWARAQKGFVRVNKDDLRAMMFPPMMRGDPTALRPDESVVVSAQDAVIRSLMRRGVNIIVDDTNLNRDHRDRRFNMVEKFNRDSNAHRYEYEEKVFTDSYNLDLCKSRVHSRAASGGLDVPEAAIEDMHKKFIALFPKEI